MTSPTERPLPDNTQHSQQTDFHVTAGIRIRNLSKWSTAEPRPRPSGHWDRQLFLFTIFKSWNCIIFGNTRWRFGVDGFTWNSAHRKKKNRNYALFDLSLSPLCKRHPLSFGFVRSIQRQFLPTFREYLPGLSSRVEQFKSVFDPGIRDRNVRNKLLFYAAQNTKRKHISEITLNYYKILIIRKRECNMTCRLYCVQG
jgi:hypothetical protein